MASRTCALFCLIVCFLVCSSGAQEIIVAELGQDVVLPCKVPNNININITAVKWIRPGLDLKYVLFYRDGHFDPYNQHPSYQNRVDLQDKDMKDGDVSLILKNVMKNDTERYECRVFEGRKNEPISIITLVVLSPGKEGGIIGDGGNKNGVIVGSVVGVILLLAVLASVGFLIYIQPMKKKPNLSVPPDKAATEQML